MSVKQALNKAFKIVPKSHLAKQLGISYQAVNNWHLHNRMPRTEYSGETSHAKKIQEATGGAVKIEDLLGSIPPHQAA